MKNILIFSTVILFVFFSGCKKDSPTEPQPAKPPGYQENIPWQSLADSPWPANHRDMQRTGRSKYKGPQQGIILKKIANAYLQSSIVVGEDSTFYYSVSNPAKLIAAKTDGTILWEYPGEYYENTSTPLLGKEGTIYYMNGLKLYALNTEGSLKWNYKLSRNVSNNGIGIGKDGTLYVLEDGSRLTAIKNGVMLWQIQDASFGAGRRINLAFSPDGNTLYIHGGRINNQGITLVAFDLLSQTIKWKFGSKLLDNGPLVDSQGNIYFIIQDDTLNYSHENFYCLKPDGNVKWKYNIKGGYSTDLDPTIDKDGNIYFATDTLYALNYNGELRWKLHLYTGHNYSPIICDNQGTVYLNTVNTSSNFLWSITSEGTVKWTLELDELPGLSPAITSNGNLLLPTFRADHVYIIN